jgi:hypothetical protein
VIVASETFSVFDVNNMLAMCKKMTETHKVFTVINLGGFDSIGQLCVAKDHRTPLFAGDPQPAGWYQQARGYLWTALMNKDRAHRNHVRFLADEGTMNGKKVGVIYHNIPNVAPAVEQSLLPELRAVGVREPVVIRLAEDNNQAVNQIPQAVVEMQRQNVQVVYLMMNLIFKTSFIQQADKQAWRPQYTDNDHYFGCGDFTTTTYPDSYDGALCVTASHSGWRGRQDFSNPVFNQDYVRFADDVYKETFARGYEDGGGSNPDDQQAQRGLHFAFGTFFLMWFEAAQRAGAELTRAGWAAQMERTPRWDRLVTSPPMTYGPGKQDGPDSVKLVRWTVQAGGEYEARKFREIRPHRPAYY